MCLYVFDDEDVDGDNHVDDVDDDVGDEDDDDDNDDDVKQKIGYMRQFACDIFCFLCYPGLYDICAGCAWRISCVFLS